MESLMVRVLSSPFCQTGEHITGFVGFPQRDWKAGLDTATQWDSVVSRDKDLAFSLWRWLQLMDFSYNNEECFISIVN